MAKEKHFASEADLVTAFCSCIDPARFERNPAMTPKWIQYHETAGWDLLLAHPETGEQVGIEAKLSLNAKVLEQALPGRWADLDGPDYRAVLVPEEGLQNHLSRIARHLGIAVLTVRTKPRGYHNAPLGCSHDFSPSLPDGSHYTGTDWPNWCPGRRCKLPDYVPDVSGGHSAPVRLSEWKIAAIKLLILLERRGAVSRADMKALRISQTRWTDRYNGFLSPGPEGGYVRNDLTPDLKAQHPTNWAQIEADYPKWSTGVETAGKLVLGAAA